jgi:hypothetical protein
MFITFSTPARGYLADGIVGPMEKLLMRWLRSYSCCRQAKRQAGRQAVRQAGRQAGS